MSLLVALGASLLAVVLVWPLTRVLGRAAGWPLAALYLVSLGALLPSARAVFGGRPGAEASVEWVPARGWTAEFVAEPIGMFFALLALGIGVLVLVYSTAYLDRRPPAEAGTVPAHEAPPAGTPLAPAPGYAFYQLIALFTFGMLVLVLTDSLATLFVGWEITSVASAALVLGAGRPGFAPAMRALSATFVGGLALLAALALTWAYTGTDRISAALGSPVWHDEPTVAALAAVLVALAVFSKSAQFPFHYWLPGAMAAATPVSAYLHAAAVVKAGIFLALRFSPAFSDVPVWRALLVSVGLGTALMAAVFALQKFDLKQLMAYSTVSQLGWIVAAIGVGSDIAIAAAALHTLAHALFKSGLFMLVGVVDHSAHTRDIRELRRIPGRIRAMPIAFVATLLGAAGMAGIPPLLGFVSKESMLAAFDSLPAGPWRLAVLVVASLAAAGTVAYCARIVLGAFVDTDADADTAVVRDHAARPTGTLHRVSRVLLWSAVIPTVAGLPLAFALPPLGRFADAVAGAAVPGAEPHLHLALWHGFGVELGITAFALAAGAVLAVYRRPLERALDRELLGTDGAGIADAIDEEVSLAGATLSSLSASDAPARHVTALLGTVCGFALFGVLALVEGGGVEALPPLHGGLSRWSDAVLFAAIALAVGGMVRTTSRVAAVVLLSAVGIAVTVQMFGLGAPDVGLTQLMVEAITVVVFMLVLRRLPPTFHRPTPRRHRLGLVLGLAVGIAAALGTLALTSRRERSGLGDYLFDHTEEISGGHNVVNVILVEFRALDTLGELSVLGIAGIAILAVVASVRGALRDPGGDDTTSGLERHDVLDPRARAAFDDVRRNTVPLRLAARLAVPALVVVSALLFWRGHLKPGGGFIAALVAAAALLLVYLARSEDRALSGERLPTVVTGVGIGLAGLTGIAGYAWGTFLEPTHVEIAGQHLSSAMLFDAGVFLAVLGLVLVTITVLGTGRLRSDHDADPDADAVANHDADPASAPDREVLR